MLLNYTDLSPVRKSVEIEIPADLVAREEQRVTKEFARHARIPGFRPGKVPASLVRSRFAKDIQDEVLSRLLPQTFRQAVEEKGLEPVGDPHVDLDGFVSGAPIKYRAQFEVKPQIELAEYRGLEVDDPKIEVSDADVDAMIERLREQSSAYRPVTDRGLQDGDFAIIDITSVAEGIEPMNDSGHFRVGEETPLPELHEALRGKKPGEAVSFEKAYPEDAHNEAFRGKNVRHDVVLKEIRVQEKPEVDDEFARSVGGWESVAQMREAIADDIRRHREAEVLRAKRNQLGEKLVAAHDFEVPESLVGEELGKSINNYARFLASQGIDLENAELDWQKIAADFRPEAVRRVRRGLILEAIARKEGLTVSDVEVDAEIRRAAAEQGRDFAEVRHHLRHEGGYEDLRASMLQAKALDLVLREARARN
ncbi:MAG TPA: trigger factor [Thermoanaerobaculia bacterium]|nr:trigger factor [Thermoanaerobaculia bacterium]